MKTFVLNGVSVEFDEKLRYADYFISHNEGNLVEIAWGKILDGLERSTIRWDNDFAEEVRHLSRWVNEAPRKRNYRRMILDGFHVLSTENFFNNEENGEEIIDWLENSGKLAAKICLAYGIRPMNPLNHPDPTRPIRGPVEAWET